MPKHTPILAVAHTLLLHTHTHTKKYTHRLKEAGWPSTFLLVYDEAWIMQDQVAALVETTTRCKPVFDMLIFHIDPNNGALLTSVSQHGVQCARVCLITCVGE